MSFLAKKRKSLKTWTDLINQFVVIMKWYEIVHACLIKCVIKHVSFVNIQHKLDCKIDDPRIVRSEQFQGRKRVRQRGRKRGK